MMDDPVRSVAQEERRAGSGGWPDLGGAGLGGPCPGGPGPDAAWSGGPNRDGPGPDGPGHSGGSWTRSVDDDGGHSSAGGVVVATSGRLGASLCWLLLRVFSLVCALWRACFGTISSLDALIGLSSQLVLLCVLWLCIGCSGTLSPARVVGDPCIPPGICPLFAFCLEKYRGLFKIIGIVFLKYEKSCIMDYKAS